MNLQNRVELLVKLGRYIEENNSEWVQVKKMAETKNPWFIQPFIDVALQNICRHFLDPELLLSWITHYFLDDNLTARNVGIVMAGNIPLVGFHDFLCVFVSGHHQRIKLSSKDDILLRHLIEKLYDFDQDTRKLICIEENLKDCEAYIATGSNRSASIFEQYFSRYPHIIRNHKTSVAILTGNETPEELNALSDDIHLFFGLGCRNITKLFVPRNFDFIPVLSAFDKYSFLKESSKYANNFDYQLSILLLNNSKYMTNQVTLLAESDHIFSPIGLVYFEYYDSRVEIDNILKNKNEIQCIVGNEFTPFGTAQNPSLFDYADGKDTIQFLLSL